MTLRRAGVACKARPDAFQTGLFIMTTTPVLWKSSFSADAGFTLGSQKLAQTIGLANGNILVVWPDDSDSNGPSPFNDIVGRLFNPEGNALGAPFRRGRLPQRPVGMRRLSEARPRSSRRSCAPKSTNGDR
jgi:hypothetical protein